MTKLYRDVPESEQMHNHMNGTLQSNVDDTVAFTISTYLHGYVEGDEDRVASRVVALLDSIERAHPGVRFELAVGPVNA